MLIGNNKAGYVKESYLGHPNNILPPAAEKYTRYFGWLVIASSDVIPNCGNSQDLKP